MNEHGKKKKNKFCRRHVRKQFLSFSIGHRTLCQFVLLINFKSKFVPSCFKSCRIIMHPVYIKRTNNLRYSLRPQFIKHVFFCRAFRGIILNHVPTARESLPNEYKTYGFLSLFFFGLFLAKWCEGPWNL